MKSKIMVLALILTTIGGGASVAKAENVPKPLFSDVASGHWAYESLQKLVKKYDISLGYPDGSFKGERPVSRYEMASLLARVIEQVSKMDNNDIQELKKLVEAYQDELQAVGKLNEILEALQDQVDLLDMEQEKQEEAIQQLQSHLPFRLSGGIGFRYEWVTSNLSDLTQAQINAAQASVKLNLDGQIGEQIGYGARLIVGNPHFIGNTWWKLADFFAKTEFQLDRFFVRYRPIQPFTLTLGKFPEPFAESELLFDMDINPTGALQTLEFHQLTPWLSRLSLSLGETAITMDKEFGYSFLLSGKTGVDFKPWDILDIHLRGGYHHYLGEDNILNANTVATAQGQPTRFNGNLNRNSNDARFALLNGSGSAVLKLLDRFPLTLSGDYLYNVAMPSNNQGFQMGIQLGQNRKPGDFFFAYRYKYLEKDANISYFVEDQLGGTDIRAHEGQFGIRLLEQTSWITTFQAANSISTAGATNYTLRSMLLQSF